MTRLTLSLKKEWFDLIKSGVKKEEYREIKPYWEKRFEKQDEWDELEFTLGYPAADDKEKRMVFKNARVVVDEGKPEWGAEEGELYFVIRWDA